MLNIVTFRLSLTKLRPRPCAWLLTFTATTLRAFLAEDATASRRGYSRSLLLPCELSLRKMPRPCAVVAHVCCYYLATFLSQDARVTSSERERPRLKAVASAGRFAFFLAVSVRDHGSRPWHRDINLRCLRATQTQSIKDYGDRT